MGAQTSNRKLLEWVEEWAEILQPDAVDWCDGSVEEYDRLCAELVAGGTFERLNDAAAPQQLPGAVRSGRRGPRRGPHVHLLRAGDRCRPHQQLA